MSVIQWSCLTEARAHAHVFFVNRAHNMADDASVNPASVSFVSLRHRLKLMTDDASLRDEFRGNFSS